MAISKERLAKLKDLSAEKSDLSDFPPLSKEILETVHLFKDRHPELFKNTIPHTQGPVLQ